MAVRAGNQFRWGKAEKGFAEALLNAGYTVTKYGAACLARGVSEFMKNTDWEWPRGKDNGPYQSGYRGGDADHPWFTGTLHDSIVGSVIDGTRILHSVQMEPGAREHQKDRRTGAIYDGVELGRQAAERAAHTFGPGVGGLRAVLTIGVPYADTVNRSDAHYDFISPLESDLVAEVLSELQELPKKSIIAKPRKR